MRMHDLMPRKAQPWFRWYTEAAHDRKMRRLTPAQRWLFVAMCSAGRESPELGRLLVSEGEPMTDKEVAEYADVPLREVTRTLPLMERLKMVQRDEDGALVVMNMSQRQYDSDSSTSRVRAHRERSKDDVGTLQRGSEERSRNGRRNAPDTETEEETEKTPPSPPSGGKRGTRLPKDWMPPAEVRDAMRAEFPTLTSDQWRSLHEEFRDYWTSVAGSKGTKLDWEATWRNSIRRNAPRFIGRPGAAPHLAPVPAYETPVRREPTW